MNRNPQPDQTLGTELMAMLASADLDAIYLRLAMKEPDWPQFKAAMHQEIADHENNGHWEVVPRAQIPTNTPGLPAVWSMKRRRCIAYS